MKLNSKIICISKYPLINAIFVALIFQGHRFNWYTASLPSSDWATFTLFDVIELVVRLKHISVVPGIPFIHALCLIELCVLSRKLFWKTSVSWEKAVTTREPSNRLLRSLTRKLMWYIPGTIHLVVFIRRDLIWFCSLPEDASLSVRPGTAFRTKGAVAISFALFGSTFLFVTAHLTAHQEKVKERVSDIKRIIRSIDLPKNLPCRHKSKGNFVLLISWFVDNVLYYRKSSRNILLIGKPLVKVNVINLPTQKYSILAAPRGFSRISLHPVGISK